MANKLELTWYGKDEPIRVEPRLLIENTELSNTAADPETQNMLIHGDNLLALKALESKFAGQVKCIYIDPPYNANAANIYEDNIEHSLWLNLIRPRLQIMWRLLGDTGSIWISIDDNERDYLKVLCDEVFGRSSFLASIVWQKRYSRENREAIGDSHEYILVYVKDKDAFKKARNYLPLAEKQLKAYKNPDNDPRGAWQSVSLLAQGYRPNQMYEIVAPNGKVHTPPPGNCWKVVEPEFKKALADGRVTFGSDGNGVPRRKQFLSEAKGIVPWTWWPQDEVGHTGESKDEVNALFGSDISFDTPKPERLIQRIIHIASNPGDLVLDSFLGSGTTAAVAQKMGRHWIGVEMGNHAYTHCKVRMDKVIAGEDPGGITKAQNWQGGGGYRFYEVAPTLINKDPFDEYVINEDYDANMLAAAVALHEGFHYQPDGDLFWKQSVGNENSYLFVTTRHLNSPYLDSIKDTMEEGEYLIIACRSFDSGLDKAYPYLCNPVIEHEIHEGRKRIDIVFDNCAESGFFFRLCNTHGLPSRFIMVECKNYSRDVANPELDQIAGRFSPNRGQMGIIACRSADDLNRLINRCSDTYKDSRGLILPLVDDDFHELLKYKASRNEMAIDNFLQKRFHMIASK